MVVAVAKICELSFSHNYYSDGVIKNLSVEPTSVCKKLLSNYKIFFRNKSNGFVLLSTLEETDSEKSFISINKNLCFSFAVSINDPYFLNFTNLPANKESAEIYYFTNLNNNIINSKLLLSSDNYSEYVTQSDIVKLFGQKFTYTGSSGNVNVFVEVKNLSNETIISETVPVIAGNYSVIIDLTNYDPGRFKLFINGSEESDFYADSSLSGKNIYAIVEIFVSDSVPADYKLYDGSMNIAAKSYLIQFERRKTFWKYYVVMKYRTTISPSDLEITHPDSSIKFSQLPSQLLSDGSTAVPFVSNIEIDLTEATQTGIGLKSNNGSSSNFVDIENLPNASVKYSVPDIPNNKVYSEIYVYI